MTVSKHILALLVLLISGNCLAEILHLECVLRDLDSKDKYSIDLRTSELIAGCYSGHTCRADVFPDEIIVHRDQPNAVTATYKIDRRTGKYEYHVRFLGKQRHLGEDRYTGSCDRIEQGKTKF
jgi:hypothetical protein